MVPENRLQEIILNKDTDAADKSCKMHNYSESWAIIDGALIIHDLADPPSWMKQAIATQDENGHTPGFLGRAVPSS